MINLDALSDKLRAVADISGINLGPALKRLNGKQKVLEMAAKATGVSLGKRADTMADELKNEANESFITDIHGLKSSLASIGAENLSEKAAKMEMSAKSGDFSYCNESFPAFSDEIKELGEKLKAIFG